MSALKWCKICDYRCRGPSNPHFCRKQPVAVVDRPAITSTILAGTHSAKEAMMLFTASLYKDFKPQLLAKFTLHKEKIQ
jgi:hypothetical protein